jgi:perosamine synthetase
MRIPLSSPDITQAEIEAVTAVLRTPWLSQGPRQRDFEHAVATRVGAEHAVAVSSGTAGLHLCLRALGIPQGAEVITSPFSFVASVNALLYEGAVPVFVDVEPDSLAIVPERIERAITPRTRAILVVHVFGRPAPLAEIIALARRRELLVIEDACEALGADVGGRSVGIWGSCGVFSFYPNKQITTGEGGMIVTDDARLARFCRSLRNHGRDDADIEAAHLGYNYRLAELACALGSEQMKRLDAILDCREDVARRYQRRLAGHPGLSLPELNLTGARTSWFVYVVRLGPQWNREDRDWIATEMERRGIGCGRYFPPLHLQAHVRAALGHRPGDFPVTEAAAARTLALPFFNRITDAEIDEVCGVLLELVERRRARPQEG